MRRLLLTVWIGLACGAPRPLEGQVQTVPSQNQDNEAQRRLIQYVADSLRKTDPVIKAAAVPKGWKPARTPWGDPDIAGIYSNSDEHFIPFERPAEFEGRRLEDITAEEFARIQATRREDTIERVATGAPRDPGTIGWWEAWNARNSRVWLVFDPPDGKIPPLTPEGQRRDAARAETTRRSGRGPADSYEDRNLYERCISRGLPGSMMPEFYGNAYQVHQGPGYVAIRYETIHETRVIPISARPHVGSAIQTYMGDARGRWDGDMLVVDTTNFKIRYREAEGTTLHLMERFKPIGPNTVEWSVTVDDPSTWARPWAFAMNLTKTVQSQQPYEYACHEGNYDLRHILSAARAEEERGQR